MESVSRKSYWIIICFLKQFHRLAANKTCTAYIALIAQSSVFKVAILSRRGYYYFTLYVSMLQQSHYKFHNENFPLSLKDFFLQRTHISTALKPVRPCCRQRKDRGKRAERSHNSCFPLVSCHNRLCTLFQAFFITEVFLRALFGVDFLVVCTVQGHTGSPQLSGNL